MSRRFLALLATASTILIHSGCSEPVNESGQIPPGPTSAKRIAIPTAPGVVALPINTAQVCEDAPPLPVATRSGFSDAVHRLAQTFSVTPLFAQDGVEDHTPHTARGNGDVHLRTLNNTYYDFQGAGEFVALRSADGQFELQVRHQPYGTSRSISIATAAAMNVAGDRVGFYPRLPHPFYIGDTPVEITKSTFPLKHGGRVEVQGNEFVVTWPNHSQVRVIFGTYLDYVVTLCPPHKQSVAGLLGQDNNPKVTLVTADGKDFRLSGSAEDQHNQLYHVLGHGWRVRQRSSLFHYERGENTATFTDLKFPYPPDPAAPRPSVNAEAACRSAGLTGGPALDDCILDVSSTGDIAFAENDAFIESLYDKSRRVEAGAGNFHCSGKQGQPGWQCNVANLIGGRVGSMMTLRIETLSNGKPTFEDLPCGPITTSFDATCNRLTAGVSFQNAQTIERFTLRTGEVWEIRSKAVCTPPKNPGEPC